MIVIWDSIKGIPIKTIFDPHENGVEAVAISHDSMRVASLSKSVLLSVENHIPRNDGEPLDFPNAKKSEKRNVDEEKGTLNVRQEISIWQWTSERSTPILTTLIEGVGDQSNIHFHPTNPHLLITNGTHRVIFWNTFGNKLWYDTPPASSRFVIHFVVFCILQE